MANNITNELTFKNCSPEKCREILEAIQLDEYGVGSIDFNKIIPQPEGLYMGDLGPKEWELYKDNNWYDWRHKHWGTKWNSYGYEDGVAFYEDKNQIFFMSANSCAIKIAQALSEQYPDVTLRIRYADEDFGYNTGSASFTSGEITESYLPDFGTLEAQKFAADVMGIELKFYPEYGYGYVLSVEGDRFEYCEGVHISPSFQCDQSLGHPVVLCYDFDNEKVWLEGFRLHETDESLAQSVRESIKSWGIHHCHSWDDFNSYVQCLGDDAMEVAYYDEGGMTMC